MAKGRRWWWTKRSTFRPTIATDFGFSHQMASISSNSVRWPLSFDQRDQNEWANCSRFFSWSWNFIWRQYSHINFPLPSDLHIRLRLNSHTSFHWLPPASSQTISVEQSDLNRSYTAKREPQMMDQWMERLHWLLPKLPLRGEGKDSIECWKSQFAFSLLWWMRKKL